MTSSPTPDGCRSWKPWSWTQTLQDRAVANARAASTECSRRRVEREEVMLYLAACTASSTVVAQHLA